MTFIFGLGDPLIDLLDSIDQKVWSPKTKAAQTFMNILI